MPDLMTCLYSCLLSLFRNNLKCRLSKTVQSFWVRSCVFPWKYSILRLFDCTFLSYIYTWPASLDLFCLPVVFVCLLWLRAHCMPADCWVRLPLIPFAVHPLSLLFIYLLIFFYILDIVHPKVSFTAWKWNLHPKSLSVTESVLGQRKRSIKSFDTTFRTLAFMNLHI